MTINPLFVIGLIFEIIGAFILARPWRIISYLFNPESQGLKEAWENLARVDISSGKMIQLIGFNLLFIGLVVQLFAIFQ